MSNLVPINPPNFRQLPPVWEIKQPFQVGADGAIAFNRDPVAWAQDHILALLLTSPGERVMRPTYGAGMYRRVFETDNPVIEQQIISIVQAGVATWEPNVTLNEIQFVPQLDYSGIMELQIAFSIGGAPQLHTVTISLGGTGIEVSG